MKLHRPTQLAIIDRLFDISLREDNKSTPIGAYLAKDLIQVYKLKAAYKKFTKGHEWKSYGSHCFCRHCGKDKDKVNFKKVCPDKSGPKDQRGE